MALLDAGQALSYVQSVKTTEGGGISLFDQLKVALAQALDSKPDNLFDTLETSYLAKQQGPNHHDNAPLVASTVSLPQASSALVVLRSIRICSTARITAST